MIVVPCNSCGMTLPDWAISSGKAIVCPDCGTEHEVNFYPAALRVTTAEEARSAAEGEATCYDHPNSRAAAACAQCGRFVCQLCAIEFQGSTYCPSCMAMGRQPGTKRDIATSRVAYDSIALTVALGSILFFPFIVFTAPIAIFLSLRYWKRPIPLMHRNRWRFVAALVVGCVELGGLAWLIVFLILRRSAPAA